MRKQASSLIDVLLITGADQELLYAKQAAEEEVGMTWTRCDGLLRSSTIWLGDLVVGDGDLGLRIGAVECARQGFLAASILAMDIASQLRPPWLVMTGVCAGWQKKGIHLGDVVATPVVQTYDYGKWVSRSGEYPEITNDVNLHSMSDVNLNFLRNFVHTWAPRQQSILNHFPPPRIVQKYNLLEYFVLPKLQPEEHIRLFPLYPELVNDLVQSEMLTYPGAGQELVRTPKGYNEWERLRKDSEYLSLKNKTRPTAHCGLMASGPHVVEDPAMFDRLKRTLNRDIIALDREAIALGVVKDFLGLEEFLAVKGVQDHADSSKNDFYREYAVKVSTAFAFDFLKKVLKPRRLPPLASVASPRRRGTYGKLRPHEVRKKPEEHGLGQASTEIATSEISLPVPGAYHRDSRFAIPRREWIDQALSSYRRDQLAVIYAPFKGGKKWFMEELAATLRNDEQPSAQVVLVDAEQTFTPEALRNGDALALCLLGEMAGQLENCEKVGVSSEVEGYFRDQRENGLGWEDALKRCIGDKFLAQGGELVLAITGADHPLDQAQWTDFMIALRNWLRDRQPKGLPRRGFRLLLSSSVSPGSLVRKLQVSPFNLVGAISLPDLNDRELHELAKCFDLVLTDLEGEAINAWLGGKIYPTSILFAEARRNGVAPSTLLAGEEVIVQTLGSYLDIVRSAINRWGDLDTWKRNRTNLAGLTENEIAELLRCGVLALSSGQSPRIANKLFEKFL